MARLALKLSQKKRQKAYLDTLAKGKKPKFSTRVYNRCSKCGRNHGYMGRFGLCRICFRELASLGQIMGVRKSSW